MSHFDWRSNGMTRADGEDAQEKFAQGQPLTAREWAIWVWTQTDVPTCPVTEKGRLAAGGYWQQTFLPRPQNQYRHMPGISYLSPAEIAKRGGPWDRASGGRMAQWILLLDNNMAREAALQANGSLARQQGNIRALAP